ncbi:MAG: dihydropteroate synthase [Deinococcales bacterium]
MASEAFPPVGGPVWAAAEHRLTFRRPVAGARRCDDGWVLRWRASALMGILNVTPDSFSDGGRFPSGDPAAAVEAGLALREQGAAFVDVGGESSRPGAEGVPEAEEMRRVLPVVAALADAGVRVSIDTVKPAVAREALAAGACLVNDIRGLDSAEMRAVCAEAGAVAVVMHMQGEPRTMQRAPRYRDVVGEVERTLLQRAQRALDDGVPSVLLDPGLGFGKTVEHNVALLAATPRLAGHGLPLLVGASRKRTIGRLGASGAGEPAPRERLPGTLAAHLYAAERGASMLRVHDVAEHRQALAVLRALAEREALDGETSAAPEGAQEERRAPRGGVGGG